MKQNTIKSAFTLSGKGLHTGLDIEMTVKPAEANTGIRICRVDMEGQPTYPALADYVHGTSRGTVLEVGDWKVSTVEHGMAALFAMHVDNALIEVNAPEFPILDGSAEPYIKAIKEVGLEEQKQDCEVYVVTKREEYINPETGARVMLIPDDKFSVDVHVAYPSKLLSNQYAYLDNLDDFPELVAGARTFVFVREIEPLLAAGLIKGGDLKNACVIYDEELPQERLDAICDAFHQDHLESAQLGYLNGSLKFDNEPARHKLLDIIGDLALIGKRIQGRVIAYHPGHKTNTSLAKQIRRDFKKLDVMVPAYNPADKPLYDINDIRRMLPHRYPFALVDKVMSITDRTIIAVKNVTVNEPFFQGHFPEEPVMPGVLQVEAMAQAGGLFVLSQVEDPTGYSTYFMKINNVKFRQKIVPGDTIVFSVALTDDLRRGIASMKGYAFVGGKIASECEFTAQIVKNK